MKKKLLALFLIIAMVGTCMVAFVGCKSNKTTILLDWAPNTNHTGIFVADYMGYFKDEGINVDIIVPDMTGTSGSVASGNAQFGIDFQEQMIFNEMKGINVTAVASIVQHNTSGILSPKDRNILSPKDFEGKKYSTWNLSGEQAIVRAMMKSEGADPSKLTMDPKFVTNIIAEFESHMGVDMVWSYAGWDKIRLEREGLENNFIPMKDIPGLDYYTPVIIASNDVIENDPELVKGFVRAVSKGYEYAIENPVDAAEILIAKNPAMVTCDDDKEFIIESQKYLSKEYQSDAPQWGYIDAARWDGFFDLMCSLGEKDFPTDITDGYGFTNDFLPKK